MRMNNYLQIKLLIYLKTLKIFIIKILNFEIIFQKIKLC